MSGPGGGLAGDVRLVDDVPTAFAGLVVAEVGARIADGATTVSLVVSGGSTARSCYRALAERGDDVPWSRIDAYVGDERCVPPDDEDSNHRMVVAELLGRVEPVHADHPMYVGGSPDAAASAYQELVAEAGRLDVVHLGLGPDGHTASLFPGAASLDIDDADTLVVATRDPNGRNPHDRLTLTLPALARARVAVFTVEGGTKAEALSRVAAGEDLPATRAAAAVTGSGGRVVWLVDAAARGGTDLGPDVG